MYNIVDKRLRHNREMRCYKISSSHLGLQGKRVFHIENVKIMVIYSVVTAKLTVSTNSVSLPSINLLESLKFSRRILKVVQHTAWVIMEGKGKGKRLKLYTLLIRQTLTRPHFGKIKKKAEMESYFYSTFILWSYNNEQNIFCSYGLSTSAGLYAFIASWRKIPLSHLWLISMPRFGK